MTTEQVERVRPDDDTLTTPLGDIRVCYLSDADEVRVRAGEWDWIEGEKGWTKPPLKVFGVEYLLNMTANTLASLARRMKFAQDANRESNGFNPVQPPSGVWRELGAWYIDYEDRDYMLRRSNGESTPAAYKKVADVLLPIVVAHLETDAAKVKLAQADDMERRSIGANVDVAVSRLMQTAELLQRAEKLAASGVDTWAVRRLISEITDNHGRPWAIQRMFAALGESVKVERL